MPLAEGRVGFRIGKALPKKEPTAWIRHGGCPSLCWKGFSGGAAEAAIAGQDSSLPNKEEFGWGNAIIDNADFNW